MPETYEGRLVTQPSQRVRHNRILVSHGVLIRATLHQGEAKTPRETSHSRAKPTIILAAL